MLENFTVRTFSEHLGDTFRIYPDAATPLDVVLITASELGGRPEEEPAGHRRPFSIVFRGPGDVLLPSASTGWSTPG